MAKWSTEGWGLGPHMNEQAALDPEFRLRAAALENARLRAQLSELEAERNFWKKHSEDLSELVNQQKRLDALRRDRDRYKSLWRNSERVIERLSRPIAAEQVDMYAPDPDWDRLDAQAALEAMREAEN